MRYFLLIQGTFGPCFVSGFSHDPYRNGQYIQLWCHCEKCVRFQMQILGRSSGAGMNKTPVEKSTCIDAQLDVKSLQYWTLEFIFRKLPQTEKKRPFSYSYQFLLHLTHFLAAKYTTAREPHVQATILWDSTSHSYRKQYRKWVRKNIFDTITSSKNHKDTVKHISVSSKWTLLAP